MTAAQSKKTTLELSGLQIELIQKKMRSVSIRVCPPLGQIRVSAPLHYSREKIIATLQPKLAWMNKHSKKFEEVRNRARAQKDSISKNFLFGREMLPNELGDLKKIYRNKLETELKVMVEKWSFILGVQANSWSIRQMKTKWGSCNCTDRKIVFNLELAKHSLEQIEYVVVHELIHLIEPSHNARFKRFMSETVPEWKRIKHDLDQDHLWMNLTDEAKMAVCENTSETP